MLCVRFPFYNFRITYEMRTNELYKIYNLLELEDLMPRVAMKYV